MWILFVLLFTLSNGLEREDGCKSMFSTCTPEDRDPVVFPENAEEMNQICSRVIKYVACLVSAEDKCGVDPYRPPRNFHIILEALSKICDEESPLHKAITENLACYKSAIQTYNVSCSDLADDTQLASGMNDDTPYEEYPKFYCLRRVTEVACIVTKIGQTCGEFAEATALEAMDVLQVLHDSCTETARQELREMMEVIEVEEEVKSRLKKLIVILQ